jgi:hypothetical protein
MKKAISSLLAISLLLGSTTMVFAHPGQTDANTPVAKTVSKTASKPAYTKANVKVVVNGNVISFKQAPITVNNLTLVPLRGVFEEIGATVTWDGKTKTVTAIKGYDTIKLTVGKTTGYKNGQAFSTGASPLNVNGSVMVPLRAVAEAFRALVDWDPNTRTITIETDQYEIIEDTGEVETYTSFDNSLTFNHPKGWFVEGENTIILTNYDTSKAIGRGGLDDGLVKVDFYIGPNEENLSFEDILSANDGADEEVTILKTEIVTINGVQFKKELSETDFEGSTKILSLETVHNDKHIVINAYAPEGPHQQQALKSIEKILNSVQLN